VTIEKFKEDKKIGQSPADCPDGFFLEVMTPVIALL